MGHTYVKFPPLSWNGVAEEVDFDRSLGDVQRHREDALLPLHH